MSLKKIALVAVVLLAAVISFTIIAPWAADPVNHASTIEKTENKISAVMTLSGGAAGASATLSVLPGDLCTPLATELAELAKYFLIILSALYLEKFLITISGYITFSVLIPLALIIVAAVIISGNKRFLSLAGKLAIIGVIIYLIVPASTMLSDKIYQTQEDTVAQTIEEYNNLDISGDSDSGIIGEITTITTNTIDKVTNFISDLTESLAVMIVTACIVPVLVFVLLVWIMKVMFYAGGNL
jgi:ABC-type multidrug transport system fused ATPase/permease subunit